MKKSRLMGILYSSLLAFSFVVPAKASLLFESATGPFDTTTNAGSSLSVTQHLGARFTLTERSVIDGIGGSFLNFPSFGGGAIPASNGDIFGAIVELNDNGFPSNVGLALDNVIASTIFSPTSGADFIAPISVTLDAGTYGVVFGAGLFGTTGSRTLTLIQPGEQTSVNGVTFSSSSEGQQDSASNRHRLVVSGTVSPVPVPAAVWLFGSGLVGLAGIARRKKTS